MVQQDYLVILIVEVFALWFINEDDSCKVVLMLAVLAQHIVRLLSLERQDKQQSWSLVESVLKHDVLIVWIYHFLADLEQAANKLVLTCIEVLKYLPKKLLLIDFVVR